MSISEARLVEHYRRISAERLGDLPICNPALAVEAVGFLSLEGQRLGVLITPWFMNLAILPAGEETTDLPPGSLVTWTAADGSRLEFNLCRDELGDYLMAVLFRSMAGFPDQDTARRVAESVMQSLLATPRPARGRAAVPQVSRRDLFTGRGSA